MTSETKNPNPDYIAHSDMREILSLADRLSVLGTATAFELGRRMTDDIALCDIILENASATRGSHNGIPDGLDALESKARMHRKRMVTRREQGLPGYPF